MSAPISGGLARGPRAEPRSFETAGSLVAVLIFGLALRLIIAYVLLPGSGFGVDRQSFLSWADNLAANGPAGFYHRGFFLDYTPGYLYVLWLIGVVGHALGGIGDLIKLPAILADVAIAWLVHSMVLELGGSRRAALLGALLFVVNPVTWFDSAVWGQVDSFGVVFLLLGLRALWRRHPEQAALFGAIAAVIKPQLGILVPVLAAVILARYLLGMTSSGRSGADHGDDDSRPLGGFDRWGFGPIRVLTSAGVGIVTAVLLSAPFSLSLVDLLAQVVKTAGGYPYLTVNAYNPWALVTNGGSGLAANGLWLFDAQGPNPTDAPTLIAGVPAILVGTGLLVLVILVVAAVVAWRLDGAGTEAAGTDAAGTDAAGAAHDPAAPRRIAREPLLMLVALMVLAIAFFVVPTRVHERYLFPAFALGAILAAVSPRWRIAYVVLAVANFANLYSILTEARFNNPGISDWLGLSLTLHTAFWISLIAVAHLAVFIWAFLQLRPRAMEHLERAELREPRNQPTGGLLSRLRGAGVTTGAVTGMSSQPGLAGRPALTSGSVAPGPIVVADAVLPDRSERLRHEPGGRFDRLDVWLLIVIVIAALTLRTFRAAEPYRMHFDEVYHARTATEFLQDWRYGIPPLQIYEWTHPHLAKYAMAVGLIAAGDDQVTAQRELGMAVSDVLVEPRWNDTTLAETGGLPFLPRGPQLPDARAGDRFYAAGGDQVRAYDLQTRKLVATWSVPGARSLALDATSHRLLVGTAAGSIEAIETAVELDSLRADASGAPDATSPRPEPPTMATAGAPIARLLLTADGSALVALTTDGTVVSFNPDTGAELGRLSVPGAADLADAGTGDAVTADPASVKDATAAARTLAAIVGGQASVFEQRLATSSAASPQPGSAVILGVFTDQQKTAIAAAIANGNLAGFSLTPVAHVAVAGSGGVTFVAAATAEASSTVDTGAAATGLTIVTGIDQTQLYVALDDKRVAVLKLTTAGGSTAPALASSFAMPGEVRELVYDAATQMVHVLGRTPDGTKDTVFVIEPHGNAVYADAALPFTAQAMALDADPAHPGTDREELLAVSSSGTLAAIDTGSNAFAWRLPGIIAGAITAGLIFLLARILFRRRDVAILAGFLVLVDGMAFVQSRIAMNDVYVGLFIVAAYALFAPLWLGRWKRPWAFWVILPIVGLLLGLALASKWVGLYALAGVVLLIIGRSALGRIITILGLVTATTVLGYMALAIPSTAVTSGPNFMFVTIMVAITLGVTLLTVLHPIAWSDEEVRLAIGGPGALGLVVFLGAALFGVASTSYAIGSVAVTPLEVAGALMIGSVVVYLLFRLAASLGMGPLAPPPPPEDPIVLTEPAAPAPEGWLRPGSMFGVPILWAVLSLGVIPLAVYVASYLPWVWASTTTRLIPSWPPGRTGQTLIDLTKSMYNYHNELRAAHPASSPYWAWPFDLKPVWFYQDSFAAGTSAAIYDAGNLVIWWLGVPALAFLVWQAFRRRSLALTLIVVAFAMQWLPWSRIDRATFQYHYYTTIPFLVIALGYFLAELRHGASAGTWRLARWSAAAAVLAPAFLWLFKGPLCAFANVTQVDKGSEACLATTPGQIVLTARVAGLIALVVVAIGLPLFLAFRRGRFGGWWQERQWDRGLLWWGAGAIVAVAIGQAVVQAVLPDTAIVAINGFSVEPIAIVILIALLPVAWIVATARDARRFVVGVLACCLIFFVAWYPNLSALPLPAALVNVYQGLLPTFLYPFQFAVNTDIVGAGPKLFDWPTLAIFVLLLVCCVIVGYGAWAWRIAIAERAQVPAEPSEASGTPEPPEPTAGA